MRFLAKTSILVVTIVFIIPFILSMKSAEDIRTSWNKAVEKKIVAQEEVEKAQKSEDAAKKSQKLLLDKVDRLDKEIKIAEEKKETSENIEKLVKQRDNSARLAEKWGSDITGREVVRKQAESKVRVLDAEVEALEKEAQSLGILLGSSDAVTTFIKEIQNNVALQKDPVSKLLSVKDALLESVEQYSSSYADQQQALSGLIVLAEDQDDPVIKGMQERIGQIKAFLANKNKRNPLNELDRSLGLYNKIKQDQEKIITKKIISMFDAIDKNSSSQPLTVEQKNILLKELQEAQSLMRNYAVADSFATSIKAGIDILTPFVPSQVPENIEQQKPFFERIASQTQAVAENYLPGAVVEGAKVTADVVASYIVFTAKEVGGGVISVMENAPGYLAEKLQDAGGKLIESSQAVAAMADQLNTVPENLESTAQSLKQVDAQLGRVEMIARYIPGQASLGLLERIHAPRELIKIIQDSNQPVQQGASFGVKVISQLSDILNVVGESLNVAGKIVSGKASEKEKLTILNDIEKAQSRIEEERQLSGQNNRTRLAGVFDSVVTAVKSIGSTLKKIINNISGRLQRAESNYTVAREKYLEALGFTPQEIDSKPTQESIAQKLDSIVNGDNASKKQNIQLATRMLVSATQDIANNYKEIADALNASQTSMEFLVKAWDTPILPQGDMARLVNNAFDLRDQKIAYLEAAKTGLALVAVALKDIEDPALQDMTQEWSKKVSTMLSGQLISTIAEYNGIMQRIDEQLKNSKKQFLKNELNK